MTAPMKPFDWDDPDGKHKPIVAFSKTEAIVLAIVLILLCIGMWMLGAINNYNRGWNDCAEIHNRGGQVEELEVKP